MTDLDDVDEGITRVKTLSTKLAAHYCENEKSFNLDEFLEAFKEFCENIKSCQQVGNQFVYMFSKKTTILIFILKYLLTSTF